MKVEVRHIDDNRGRCIGDFNPPELRSLIDFLRSGLPIYNYSQDIGDGGFEGCKYKFHQLWVNDDGEVYIDVVVDGPHL